MATKTKAVPNQAEVATAALKALVADAIVRQRQIDDTAARLKQLKHDYEAMVEQPGLRYMRQLGLIQTLVDGHPVSVEQRLSASLPPEKEGMRERFVGWLKKIRAAREGEPIVVETVHAATLSAWIRDDRNRIPEAVHRGCAVKEASWLKIS